MKKLITLLFISILSLQVYCSAQEILKVDYPAIKEYVTNHNTEFQKLMQRFEENDTLLTRQDHVMLYYGYSFTPAYKGSMDDFQDFRKLIKEEKYEDAYNIGKELLKKNPVSLQWFYNLYGIAGLLQKDIREIKHYSKRYAALLTMIALTGDGTSEETAFKVICVNDEYQLLNMLFKMENMKGQSLVNKCDLIEFDKCQYYEGNQMYFDISRSLDYMSELFGKWKKAILYHTDNCHTLCYQYAYAGLKTNIRELFARVKMFLDLEIDKQPHFLGEMIILGSKR